MVCQCLFLTVSRAQQRREIQRMQRRKASLPLHTSSSMNGCLTQLMSRLLSTVPVAAVTWSRLSGASNVWSPRLCASSARTTLAVPKFGDGFHHQARRSTITGSLRPCVPVLVFVGVLSSTASSRNRRAVRAAPTPCTCPLPVGASGQRWKALGAQFRVARQDSELEALHCGHPHTVHHNAPWGVQRLPLPLACLLEVRWQS